jgi:hypothetical protein
MARKQPISTPPSCSSDSDASDGEADAMRQALTATNSPTCQHRQTP